MLNQHELIARLRGGDRRALARAISYVEQGGPTARALLAEAFPHTGAAQIVGVTGPPGAGKSTLVTLLAQAWRARGVSVGIIAVDPSSPFTGGAVLGDRIRMQALGGDPGVFIRSMASRGLSVGIIAVDPSSPFTGGAVLGDRIRMQALGGDPGVFIRSMASRGRLGGLARATADAATLLDAAGFQLVLIETVGAGQGEVEIAGAAHTTIVVEVPGMGDDVQSIKAGMLEIADLFVVNKADREGADRTVRQLRAMLHLGEYRPDAWEPPVLTAVATAGEGGDAIIDAVARHAAHLRQGEHAAKRELAAAERELAAAVQELAVERLRGPAWAAFVARIAAREQSPYAAAEALLEGVKP